MIDTNNFLGKKAIIRGNNSGVQYGTITAIDNSIVVLENSRRIWYWSGAASLSQMAMEGVKDAKACKFSLVQATPHIITDVIEVLICSPDAINNIEGVPVWKV